MKGYTTLHAPPREGMRASFGDNDDDDNCGLSLFCSTNIKKKKYPAVYYEIEVSCGNATRKVLRRYSQFRQLCRKIEIDANNINNQQLQIMDSKKLLPPAPLFQKSFEDSFLEERMAGLCTFMKELLSRQECLNNTIVEQFLELHFDNDN